MTSQSIKALKNKEVEVMLVNKKLANDVKELQNKLNTSASDVVSAAIELLKRSINKEVVIREPKTGKESTITALSNLSN